jgi:AcrR family transcriptional regulator
MSSQPRQARAVRTRERIVRAAAEVFDEHGFSAGSMSQIARRASTTMGAMYFHFASKEEVARTVMAEQAADLKFPAGEDGLQHLLDITLELARQLRTNVLFRAGVRLAVEQGDFGLRDATPYRLWVERFSEQLAAAQEREELLPHVNVTDFARVLVGAYSGTQLLSQITSGRADLVERIAEMWRFLLPGIASPEVISRLDLEVTDAGRKA